MHHFNLVYDNPPTERDGAFNGNVLWIWENGYCLVSAWNSPKDFLNRKEIGMPIYWNWLPTPKEIRTQTILDNPQNTIGIHRFLGKVVLDDTARMMQANRNFQDPTSICVYVVEQDDHMEVTNNLITW